MRQQVTRAVTMVSDNQMVRQDIDSPSLSGICIDLWIRSAEMLDLKYSLEVVDLWPKMLQAFKENKTDVVLQRMDAGQLQKENISE